VTGLPRRLRRAIILGTTEEDCTVVAGGQRGEAVYAAVFPRPRTERVSPGHLVAIADAADGPDLVVWRWFDAVVVGMEDGLVRLWEPGHGLVLAQPRDPGRVPRPGGRAYVSAGLPGADWWVAGRAVTHAEDAYVELKELERFFTANHLWARLT